MRIAVVEEGVFGDRAGGRFGVCCLYRRVMRLKYANLIAIALFYFITTVWIVPEMGLPMRVP